MPTIRLFSFFLTRLKLVEMIENIKFDISDNLVVAAMEMLAAQTGFAAEIRAKVWIYKGEAFQVIPVFQQDQLISIFLPDIGLFQTLITLSPEKFENYAKNFGTNNSTAPLSALYLQIRQGC